MSLPAALLLDLDGTLIDSEPLHFEAYRRFLAPLGIPVTDADLTNNIGKGDPEFCETLLKRHGLTASVEEWMAGKSRVLAELYQTELRLRPGVHALLERAWIAGVPCVVVTSTIRQVATIALTVTGIAGRLPMRVCNEDTVEHKPHPAPYLLAISRLGVPAKRCLAVEDSLSGIRSVKAAGARAIAVPDIITGEQLAAVGADQVCASLDEVALDV